MRGDLHAVVQNPSDADQVDPYHPIQQQMSRLANRAVLCPSTVAAVAQMVAAYQGSQFRARRAAGSLRIGRDIAQSRDEKHLVAPPCHVPEPLLCAGQDMNDVRLSRQR